MGKTKKEIREFCVNAYNGCSTDDGKGDIETYEVFLERQLVSRIDKITELEKNTLTIHDIRNKLSPTTLLIDMMELEGFKFDDKEIQEMFEGNLKKVKECTNYLAKREIYPEENNEVEFEFKEALLKLVTLKKFKDEHGKTAEYEVEKEKAWKKAFELTQSGK